MPRDQSDLTVVELKKRLKTHGMSTAGSKTKLVSRLHEADPSNSWTGSGESGGIEGVEDVGDVGSEARESVSRREIELDKREKELAERELDLALRETLLLRAADEEREFRWRGSDGDEDGDGSRRRGNVSRAPEGKFNDNG